MPAKARAVPARKDLSIGLGLAVLHWRRREGAKLLAQGGEFGLYARRHIAFGLRIPHKVMTCIFRRQYSFGHVDHFARRHVSNTCRRPRDRADCPGFGRTHEAPPYDPSKSLALNIALAAGITTPNEGLEDWPRGEWDKLKDQPAPLPPPPTRFHGRPL